MQTETQMLSRRSFIVAGTTAAGALVFGLPSLTLADDSERQIGFFVEIRPNGDVIIGSNQPEIGVVARTVSAVLTFVVGVPLALTYGLNGAAAGVVVTQASWLLVYSWSAAARGRLSDERLAARVRET